MNHATLFVPHRTCSRCRRSKPMRGGITSPKFICAECRKPPTTTKKAA